MKKILFILFLTLSISLASQVLAETEDAIFKIVNEAYKKVGDISLSSILTPTVAEIPIPNDLNLERFSFAVYDKTTKQFQPNIFLKKIIEKPVSLSFVSENNTLISNSHFANDANEGTFVDIAVNKEGLNKVKVIMEAKDIIVSDSLMMFLDNYVALPKNITIYTETTGKQNVVLARTEVFSHVINFPKNEARKWIIELEYGQPLRIAELKLINRSADQVNLSSLRFLAQPNHEYQIFFDTDRYININLGEAGNLYDNDSVLLAKLVSISDNPNYIIADFDQDGVPDIFDNCVSIYNPDQEDLNNNGRGDACDDFDKDGIINSLDNCPNIPNRNQQDNDGDGIGDVCDDEESRITEKYKWLPWVGIIGAVIIIVGLFALTVISMKKKGDLPPQN